MVKKYDVISLIIGDKEIGFFDRSMEYFGEKTPVSEYIIGLLRELKPNEDNYPKFSKYYRGISCTYVRSVTTKWYGRDRSSYYKAFDEYWALPKSNGESPEHVVQFIKSKMRHETDRYIEMDKKEELEEQSKKKPTFFQRLFGVRS
jgi:hypothetical protein